MNLKLKTKRVNFIDSGANYVYKMRKQFQSPPNYSFVSDPHNQQFLQRKSLSGCLSIFILTHLTLYIHVNCRHNYFRVVVCAQAEILSYSSLQNVMWSKSENML